MGTTSFSFVILFSVLLGACATGNLRLQSTPSEAEVQLIDRSGGRKSLGKTPLNIPSHELGAPGDGAQLEFSKTGHASVDVFVPTSAFAKSVDIHMTLTPQSPASNSAEGTLQEVASAVADIQRDIQSRSFDLALAKLSQMVGKYPTVSTFHSLLGNVHYLERRLDKALVSYRKALELNSTSTELSKVIEKLETMNGGQR